MMKSTTAPLITAMVHPSMILRAPDDEARHEEMRRFVEDINKIVRRLPPSALRHK
jgi:hypothetical protein